MAANLGAVLMRRENASLHREQVHDDVLVDCVPDGDWHTALSQFSDIHYEQTALFGAGQRGERTSHLLGMENGRPRFGVRVGLYALPVINRGLALVRFGPFWRRSDEPFDRSRYSAAIQALIDEYCVRRKLYMIVRPRAHPDIYPIEAEVLEEMGVFAAETTELARYLVDATLSEEEQLKSLDKRWRYNLKASLAHDLEVRIGESAEEIATFQRIFAEMVRRKNLVYPGVDLVDLMPQLVKLSSEMRLHVALAYHQGQPVAGTAFAVNGDVGYYVFAATSDDAAEMQAGYAVQWSVLRWLRDNATVRWYDLGGPGDPGLKQYKKGLAGKRGVLLPMKEFHYCTDNTARSVVRMMFGLRNARNKVQRWQRGN